MSIKAKVGDIFLVKVDSQRFAVGQLISNRKGEMYCVIYDIITDSTEFDMSSLSSAKVILFALTLDAKFWHGHWIIVSNTKDNLKSIPKPIFKIETLLGYKVEDLNGEVIKGTKNLDKSKLQYRTVVAPVRLEKAVKAYYNEGPWLDQYDSLKASYLYIG